MSLTMVKVVVGVAMPGGPLSVCRGVEFSQSNDDSIQEGNRGNDQDGIERDKKRKEGLNAMVRRHCSLCS